MLHSVMTDGGMMWAIGLLSIKVILVLMLAAAAVVRYHVRR